MSPWYTRPDRTREPTAVAGTGLNPTLLFHKWQCYDLKQDQASRQPATPTFDRKATGKEFLRQVVRAVEAARQAGEAWASKRYLPALTALDAHCVEASTIWRLVTGLATNPAFETGLALHPLYGFPFLPGSGVKGLVHHAAEAELVAGHEDWVHGDSEPELPDEPTLARLVEEAELVRVLFGSLTLEPRSEGARPRTARSLLAGWRGAPGLGKPMRQRLAKLLDTHTGGMVSFFDAVPAPNQAELLQTDIVNPHYPDYYREPANHPPSDDQDPIPVYFLAVRPGVKFSFPFRLATMPQPTARDEAEQERLEVIVRHTEASLVAAIRRWLVQGLTELGAGGKTAAGYGYFSLPAEIPTAEEPERE